MDTDLRTTTERELLARHVRGDAQAFTELARRWTPALRNMLRRLLSRFPDGLSDDVLQLTLWNVHKFASSFRPPYQFGPWVMRIARNMAFNLMRAEARRGRVIREWPEIVENDTGLRRLVEFVDERHEAADLTMEQRERLAHGRRLVRQLKPDYRQVFEMREVDGLTYEEIAARLGLALGTVKSRLHRARLMIAALRDCA